MNPISFGKITTFTDFKEAAEVWKKVIFDQQQNTPSQYPAAFVRFWVKSGKPKTRAFSIITNKLDGGGVAEKNMGDYDQFMFLHQFKKVEENFARFCISDLTPDQYEIQKFHKGT